MSYSLSLFVVINSFVSDIAIFVLKRDVKLQLTQLVINSQNIFRLGRISATSLLCENGEIPSPEQPVYNN